MWTNYLKIALRNLRSAPGYSFINVAGLAVGLAACMIIALYVRDEVSYDHHHVLADRIVRVNLNGALGGQFINTANTSVPLGPTFMEEFPEVEAYTRFRVHDNILMVHEDQRYYEDAFIFTDSTVFDVFTFPLLSGDPARALAEPNTVVISERAARKYFGDDDPMGQTLLYDNRTAYRVTGVMKDPVPTSRFQFDFLASFVSNSLSRNELWVNNGLQTYLVLAEGAEIEALEAKFPDLIRKYVAPQIEQALGQSYDEALAAGLQWGYYLDRLPGTYLRATATDQIGPTSDAGYVYILSAIAVFTLLIACINFMNLSTARSSNRAREVGVRKVLGSSRRQLVRQFLGESVLTAFLALAVALLIVWAILPVFNVQSGKTLVLFSGGNAGFLLGMTGITLVVGLLAGFYPAAVLSAFQPAAVLKGSLAGGARRPWLRNTLVVTQFAISVALLAGTGIVFNQLDYLQSTRLGFDGEQVVVLPIESEAGRQGYEAFREELLALPGVINVAASNQVPGRFSNTSAFRPADAPGETAFVLAQALVSYDFLPTLDIEVVAGRGFSRDYPTDATDAYVINEAAARNMGLDVDTAPGTPFMEIGSTADNAEYGQIIGVVRDFHFESLHTAIRPMVLSMNANAHSALLVRLQPEDVEQSLAQVQQAWEAYEPGYPYRYTFLDQDFGRLYQQERQLGQLFGAFTLLAILIACLGLFGLASFITTQRTKEIGVRKVLGASAPGIVVLLSKEFTKLVVLAAVVALPVAYVLMDRWLRDFAYHVEISWTIFLMAGLAALGIAWVTVSYHSIKAALADPVRSLRYE